jgi:hypothetical protein
MKTASEYVNDLIMARKELALALALPKSASVDIPSGSALDTVLLYKHSANHVVAVRHWFQPKEMLFIVIDPTHQMKSMRNQLSGILNYSYHLKSLTFVSTGSVSREW